MKNFIFLLIGIISIIFLSLIISSCGKKNPVEAHNVTVTMTYTPNPAVVNASISFTFQVKDSDVPTNMSSYTCTLQKGATGSPFTMALTQGGTGTYTGQATFTEAGTYSITLKFNHEGVDETKELSITVQ